MNPTVRDIMNPQLLYVEEDDAAHVVQSKILGFGVSGVPVLDRSYRPVGFVSLRDLSPDGKTMCISSPAVTTRADASIETAAQQLVARDLRHLVVVDDRGVAVGIVSALDVVRAYAGLSPLHPATFEAECTSAAAFRET